MAELPPLAVKISEHRLQRLRCAGCGGTIRAELPADVPPVALARSSAIAPLPLLEWGSTGKRQRHVRAFAKNLLKLWPPCGRLPTSANAHAAERGVRAAVIYRKPSRGNRSQGGERTIERLLSVDRTCRLVRPELTLPKTCAIPV